MKREFSAGAVVYHMREATEVEYLVLHYGTNHWDFPKGKLEGSETNEEAALREIHEETGLTVTIDPGFAHRIYYKYRSREGELVDKTVTFFTAQSTVRDVTISHEHSEYLWLSYGQARSQLTYDNAVQLLDLAHAHITRLHSL